MTDLTNNRWKKKIVSPEKALESMEPGMSIFLGTGVAEPRTLVKALMDSDAGNIQDLELVQLISMGEAISDEDLVKKKSRKFRLKTFFSGWVASEAITEGRVDLIPSRFSRIYRLFESGKIHIDAAFVQVTPPDDRGYCSLGVAVDVARHAMDQARIVVGELNHETPFTFGDTLVHVSEFTHLVKSTHEPIYLPRWPHLEVHKQLAANIASLIDDGSCICFSTGPMFEALAKHLGNKKGLGIHSPVFTDALMDLVNSGAVSNRKKGVFRGKSLASYAAGTRELFKWLHRNPLVEFQGLEKVFHPSQIGRNPRFVALLPARKVDITGRIALHAGKRNVTAGPGEAMNFVNGAELSEGGITIFGLPSRNLKDRSNIVLNAENFPNLFSLRESVDLVVTEFGVADLAGRSVRERAQALIEIAHPDDREELVRQAKKENILFADQIFMAESTHLYPSQISTTHTFGDNLKVRFRAIKPSDEEGMRRLFYRFSDQAVYSRYFSPIKTMPHAKMQHYVNIDYRCTLSVVGLVGEPGQGKIISEARFVLKKERPFADVAFIVDEQYQGRGIATYLLQMLTRLAKERGIRGFTADVLATNKAMRKVLENSCLVVKSKLENGVFSLEIPFENINS